MISSLFRIFREFIKKGRSTSLPEQEADDKMERLVDKSLETPFSFSIDIVDACNLRCVHCPRGIYYKKSTSTRMELGIFRHLLDKITDDCKCRKIELLNWTEPFLHPELDKFVYSVRAKKIQCILSSNLSFRNPSRLESVLMHSPGLIVSVSGFEQKTHERYHKGSNLEQVKSNLELIAELREKRNLPLHVEIHCLQFTDNQSDQLLWGKYCNDNDFIFKAKPAFCSEVTTPESGKRLLYQPEFYLDSNGETKVRQYFSQDPNFEPCPLHNNIPIDARCDVYLCCVYWNHEQYKIDNYFDASLKSIQLKRLSHPECLHCTVFRKS